MQKRFYLSLLLVILTGIILCYGCGGNNTGYTQVNVTADPINNITSSPTPTPVLVQKPVSGYLLVTSSVTDEGDNVENLNIFDLPATEPDESGNQPVELNL